MHIDVKSSSVIKSDWPVKVSCTEQYVCSYSEHPTHPTDSDLIVLVTHQLLLTNVQSTWGICTTWATGVTAVSIPGHTPFQTVITVPWILYGHTFSRRRRKKKISCINKTYISVISTCAVSRAAPSFRTCACWPTVMEHSDCCYKTLYHWLLSSPFPFVHLYSFDTRWHSLARRPVFPICNIFCKFTILTPTKRRASGGELRVSRRTRVECF